MGKIQVITKPATTPNVFNVYWRVGAARMGCVETTVAAAAPADKHIIAEMAALRYLLLEKAAAGENASGVGLDIVVSSGAIKKATHKDTAKIHLVDYAHFLVTRFADAKFSVEKDESWLPAENAAPMDKIKVDRPALETIFVHGVGNVVLTRHALERYNERMGTPPTSDEPKNIEQEAKRPQRTFAQALKSLRKIAASSLLKPIQQPQSLELKKIREHGIAVLTLNHPDALVNLLVGKDKGVEKLITVVTENLGKRNQEVYRGAFKAPSTVKRN